MEGTTQNVFSNYLWDYLIFCSMQSHHMGPDGQLPWAGKLLEDWRSLSLKPASLQAVRRKND